MQKPTLTLGVTGRRHIVPEALDAVVESARLFFHELADAYDGEIRVCTGLAVGADSIAARLALEEKDRRPNAKIRLIAVLPSELSRYERDFKRTPDSSGRSQLDEFHELLERCDERVSLADPSVDATDPLACYERLGNWLVENCDVLLAFWNGNTSVVKRGGTVDVALRKTRRFATDGSAVFCISTPELLRKKNPDGTKTYTPEPLDGAGDVALLIEEPKGAIPFVDPTDGIRRFVNSL